MADGVTKYIADFAANLRFEDLPDTVVERGKVHILDSLGLNLAGSVAPVTRALREHVQWLGAGEDGASVLGTNEQAAMRFAASINATAIHADNFDDTCPQESPDRNGGIHASGPVLATALALSEMGLFSGQDLLVGFHVGVEIASRLNHAIAARHYADGFHSTGTLSVFGTAAAAGKLMGLDATGLEHAIAGAASRSAGIRRNFGSMVEPMHAGNAAEDGFVAADLASRGVTGAENILEGPSGFFEAAGGGYLEDAIVGRLGNPWAFDSPGMWIKPYPNGALTHPAMTSLGNLIRDNKITVKDVKRLGVRTNRRIQDILADDLPSTGLEAKFSMEFSLAVLLVDGEAGLGAFTDAAVARPDVQEVMGRVEFGIYDLPEPDYTNVTTLLDVELVDGTRLDGRADFARGSTQDPMSFDDVASKFRTCAAYVDWPKDKTEQAIDIIARIDRLDHLSDLTAALTVSD